MDLSIFTHIITIALAVDGWEIVIEDNLPDLKQLACSHQSGPLDLFSRLDVLIMTPEFNPETAAGVCLCFLYYADPARVTDMRGVGRLIRQDQANTMQTVCESILTAAGIASSAPTVTIITRPKQQMIRFGGSQNSYPAFMVEFDYWLPREIYQLVEQRHGDTKTEAQTAP